MDNKLAIIIPAYKPDYFRQTLQSIANQTCKNFTLYVGDDASPADLYSVVNEFKNDIDIVYERFTGNLGGKDLVAQWNRCVSLAKNEEWIWLFSDDDLMPANGVELFYISIAEDPTADLLHFNVEVIDEHNAPLKKCSSFPPLLTSSDFFKKRIQAEISSFVVEYIFKKELYESNGKFVHFDLGWFSDDATWINFGRHNGIKTIEGAVIQWRYSTHNISSRLSERSIVLRKLNASMSYYDWVKDFFIKNNTVDPTSQFAKVKKIILTLISDSDMSFKEKYTLTTSSLDKIGLRQLWIPAVTYILYKELGKLRRQGT